MAIMSLSTISFSQTINPCATYEHTADDPQAYLEFRALRDEIKNSGNQNIEKAAIYTIPIVFHILHDGGETNISKEQVFDALRILNEDYNGLNPDIGNVDPVFAGGQADVQIEFVLASKAPDGTCFAGITRTFNPTACWDGSMDQVQAIKVGNDIYNGDWLTKNYLNVYVVGSLTDPGSQLITLGYTSFPSGSGNTMDGGFHVIYNAVGSIEAGGAFDISTSTHEIGHWLGLDHTWGGTNNPDCDGTATSESDPCWNTSWWIGPIGPVDNCDWDDNVDDTPLTTGIQGGPCVNSTRNSCSGDNAYWGFDIKDQVENYMDYAHCGIMFSEGQKTVMHGVLNNNTGGRNNLWTAANLAATGADSNLYLCKADFTSDKPSICVGDQIQFTDESYNVVSGWTWTFTGGTPLNSTAENPSVTYDTPGLYTVTLIATDGANDDTEIKTSFIRVLPAASSIPLVEGFETYSTLNNIEEWEVKNDGGNGFEIVNVGLNSAKSVKLANNGQPTGYYDELISAPVDLSGVTGSMTLSYRYAYKRRNSSDDDWFRVYVTGDCGENWSIRKTVHGFQLSSATQTSAYTPTSESDWMTVHMTNITSQFWVEKFRYRFVFESGGGNNFYLDNINLYEGSPSDDIVAGLNEGEEINGLAVYPNPVDDELSVRFIMNSAMSATMFIQDVSGKIVQNHLVQANQGTNVVYMDTQELSSGMYFLRVNVGGAQQTIQFVVK